MNVFQIRLTTGGIYPFLPLGWCQGLVQELVLPRTPLNLLEVLLNLAQGEDKWLIHWLLKKEVG